MPQIIRQLDDIAIRENLNFVSENFFIILLTVKNFGQEIGFITFKPFQSPNAELHKILLPTTGIELVRFIGSMNFNSKIIDTLLINTKRLYDLLHDNNEFHWSIEQETV